MNNIEKELREIMGRKAHLVDCSKDRLANFKKEKERVEAQIQEIENGIIVNQFIYDAIGEKIKRDGVEND